MITRTAMARSGDTWDILALRHLGSERYMGQMLRANPAHYYLIRIATPIEIVIPDTPDPVGLRSRAPWRRR